MFLYMVLSVSAITLGPQESHSLLLKCSSVTITLASTPKKVSNKKFTAYKNSFHFSHILSFGVTEEHPRKYSVKYSYTHIQS
jgi:hypothetical protein